MDAEARETAWLAASDMAAAKTSAHDLVHIKCRAPGVKRTFELPVLPTAPVSILVDMASELVPNLDARFCRVLAKAKTLDFTRTFADQGVVDGATVMFVASLPEDVIRVQNARSDATVRSFEQEEERDLARRLASWTPEQDAVYRFCKFEFCERFASPHPFEAERLLQKLATDPGIVSVMRRHKMTVLYLCEMDPQEDVLARKKDEEGACLLGYNQNAGERIYIRLRNDDGMSFRGYQGLVNTLLHELAHNFRGPHDDVFWSTFAQFKTEYAAFVQAEKGRAGADVSRTVETALRNEMGNKALAQSERKAVSTAVKSRHLQHAPPAAPAVPTLGGSHSRAREEARKRFADAAEKRIADKAAKDNAS